MLECGGRLAAEEQAPEGRVVGVGAGGGGGGRRGLEDAAEEVRVRRHGGRGGALLRGGGDAAGGGVRGGHRLRLAGSAARRSRAPRGEIDQGRDGAGGLGSRALSGVDRGWLSWQKVGRFSMSVRTRDAGVRMVLV